MINSAEENLIAIRDVPRRLPPRPNGKLLHISAVYRWTLRGLKGVRLETVRIGGTTYTSREALQRFSERLTRVEPALEVVNPVSRARQQQIYRAMVTVTESLGVNR
jgi:hypothetical protein